MTEYTHRATIRVPAALRDDANVLAMVLGESPADIATFKAPAWEDVDGNLYSLASTVIAPTWIGKATTALDVPEHAPEADMEAAQRAQALVIVASLEEPLEASPGAIVAILGSNSDSPSEHLNILGLSRVTEDKDEEDPEN